MPTSHRSFSVDASSVLQANIVSSREEKIDQMPPRVGAGPHQHDLPRLRRHRQWYANEV
jgi:hypothetical protein